MTRRPRTDPTAASAPPAKRPRDSEGSHQLKVGRKRHTTVPSRAFYTARRRPRRGALRRTCFKPQDGGAERESARARRRSLLDESCSSSSLHPTLTLVARSSSFFAASHLFFPSHGCRRKRQMTRVRMRQHEYYFIVQRRLARHYCWLELLSRPTSVLAHDRRSLYASCAFLCRSPHRAAPWVSQHAGVSACRPGASRHVPCLSFKRHLCGPFFCASLEVRRPPRITRAIAARTRRQTTVSTRDRQETAHDHVRGPPLHR